MTDNSQVVQSMYAALAGGDIPAFFGAFDPAIVWNEAENFPYADGNPYVGPEKVASGIFGRLVADWDGFSATPEQFVAQDDTVVAIGRYRATYKLTAIPINAQFVHVWTVRNGKVTAFQQYTDTMQFAMATGAGVI